MSARRRESDKSPSSHFSPPCPSLRAPAVLGSGKEKPSPGGLDVIDSGYGSSASTEVGAATDDDADEDPYAVVRNDEFEQNAARDWLVNLVKKGSDWMDECDEDSSEWEERENVIDKAAGEYLAP